MQLLYNREHILPKCRIISVGQPNLKETTVGESCLPKAEYFSETHLSVVVTEINSGDLEAPPVEVYLSRLYFTVFYRKLLQIWAICI